MRIIGAGIRRIGKIILTTALMLAACQTRTVTITQEVTRQVEVTVLITQQALSNQQSTPAPSSIAITPFPDAPLCPDSGEAHDNNLFHTLWDSTRGCHYD